MSLSSDEVRTLGEIAGLMVPADPGLGMPSAGDPAILADMARSVGRDQETVRDALANFIRNRPGADSINDWYAKGGDATRTLGRLILSAYYRDDRVLVALGHEARSPFPKGYEVEQGDWSLLDTVKQRVPLWRNDRGR